MNTCLSPFGKSSTIMETEFKIIERRNHSDWISSGLDIRVLGILFIISGLVDLIWILSYPEYSLTVFGRTFSSYTGEFVKFQHPVIHLAIGFGFFCTRLWAFWGYLAYLGLACASEVTTQVIQGYHPLRTSMIILSLAFGTYVIVRRKVFI